MKAGPYDIDSDGFDSRVDDLFDDPCVDDSELEDEDSEEEDEIDEDYDGYVDEL